MSDYHRMTLAQKQAHQRERAREPAVACPVCETQTTAADLIAHVETRCPGPRDPNPAARWVTWREALGMGVPRATLSFWANSKQVRFVGELQDRRYLLRDLAMKVAQRRGFRRR